MGDRPSEDRLESGSRTTRIVQRAAFLDTALAGSLPCVTCGYELKGLSIRGVCPECGTAVRATILYQVDPRAEEFQPIRHRRSVAAGLMMWSAGALGAAGACWILRIADLLKPWGLAPASATWASWAAVAFAVASGVGSLALLRPAPATPIGHTLSALVGSAAYVPLVWAMWRMLLDLDPRRAAPYSGASIQPDRILLRLIAGVAIVAALLGSRLCARDLVKRSMVMRTRRVDRQTLWGMAIVAAVTMVGDGVRYASAMAVGPDPEVLNIVGTLIIGVGSALLTLGMVGAVVDSWRIGRAVLIPSPTIEKVLGPSAR